MTDKDSRLSEFLEFFKDFKETNDDHPRKSIPCPLPPKIDLFKILRSISFSDITNVSLPIILNEPLSNTQRIIESLRYFSLLNEASNQTNEIDRLAYMAAFQISSCHTAVEGRSRKPFNPVIGETYEYVNSSKNFLAIVEQVSHYPPITASHSQSERWETMTNVHSTVKFLFTKVEVEWSKKILTYFRNDNETYTSALPLLVIHNVMSSNTWSEYVGTVTIQKVGSKAKAVIVFNKKARPDEVSKVEGKILDMEGTVKGTISGSYNTELYYTNVDTNERKLIWKAEEMPDGYKENYGFTNFSIQLNEAKKGVLCPTDARHRSDIRMLEEGKIDEGEREKVRLEKSQRKFHKELSSDRKAFTPKWFELQKVPEIGEELYVYSSGYWRSKLSGDYSGVKSIFN